MPQQIYSVIAISPHANLLGKVKLFLLILIAISTSGTTVFLYYGNPSSQHQLGKNARQKLEEARGKIAKYLSVSPEEIIFTSGGTESNNLAIKGLASANPDKKHIILCL